ncbi:MAG: hypothetical protein AAF628_37550 [Planctomycetota bacterium]
MSFFGLDVVASHEAARNVEVADGVFIERRSILWLSVGAIGALLTVGSALRAQTPQGKAKSQGLTFDEFLADMLPHARRVVASKGQDEEAYLMNAAAALSRLRNPGAPLRKTMKAFRQQHHQDGKRFPLMAVSMQLKPGRGFKHHDHLDYNGVILGVEGELRIRNFDIVGEAPPIEEKRKTFAIRQTRDDLILPGRFSTLGRNRDNIHELVAGKSGARVLDVFTFFEQRATSRFLSVEEKPRDPEARIYDASWR